MGAFWISNATKGDNKGDVSGTEEGMHFIMLHPDYMQTCFRMNAIELGQFSALQAAHSSSWLSARKGNGFLICHLSHHGNVI